MGNQLPSVAWPRFASLNSHNSPLCRHFGGEKSKAWQDGASCLKPLSVNSRFVAAISICLLLLEPELSLSPCSVGPLSVGRSECEEEETIERHRPGSVLSWHYV